jgi:YggT family protein
VNGVLFTLTEPVLRPVRRVIPRTGMFDLSFLVVFFGIIILQQIVASA